MQIVDPVNSLICSSSSKMLIWLLATVVLASEVRKWIIKYAKTLEHMCAVEKLSSENYLEKRSEIEMEVRKCWKGKISNAYEEGEWSRISVSWLKKLKL